MIALLLWEIFATLFVIVIVTACVIKEYGTAEEFNTRYPVACKVFGIVVSAMISFFLAAVGSSIWYLIFA